VRVLGNHEDTVLAEHVIHKGGDLPEGDPFRDFVRLRFQEPLRANARGGPLYGRAFTAMSVATIAAGLASSAVATASSGETLGTSDTVFVAILGILVSVLAAITQIWRPAQRSVARYQAAYALRREGWDYVHDLGRYEALEGAARRPAFITEVNRIHRGVEAIDESIAEEGPAEVRPGEAG
jgi:hypothetical protein